MSQADTLEGSPHLHKKLQSLKTSVSASFRQLSHMTLQKKTLRPPGGAFPLEWGPDLGRRDNPVGPLVGPAEGGVLRAPQRG